MSEQELSENWSIEDKITLLKLKAIEYDEMTDQNKITNLDKYNKIVKEKDNCIAQLEKYKELIMLIDTQTINTNEKSHNNDIFDSLLQKIHEIKNKMNNQNVKLDELIELHVQLTEIKSQFEACSQNKKLEIIKLQ